MSTHRRRQSLRGTKRVWWKMHCVVLEGNTEYLFLRVDQHLQSALANIPSVPNPDKMWHAFNSAIRDNAVHGYKLPTKKVVPRPTETEEAKR